MKNNFKTYPHYKEINKLLQQPQNKHCADCNAENPTWASINIGVFVCINCAGIHRQLGVSLSKIKSITLDIIQQDVVNALKCVNNEIVNKYWEAKVENKNKMKRDEIMKFIKEKYAEKKYVVDVNEIDPFTVALNKIKEKGSCLSSSAKMKKAFTMTNDNANRKYPATFREDSKCLFGNSNSNSNNVQGNESGEFGFNFSKMQSQDIQTNDPFSQFFK
jgi:stromal membrane-associated protein